MAMSSRILRVAHGAHAAEVPNEALRYSEFHQQKRRQAQVDEPVRSQTQVPEPFRTT